MSTKRRIVSRDRKIKIASRRTSRKKNSRKISTDKKSKPSNKKIIQKKRSYLIQRRRRALAEKIGNRYMNSRPKSTINRNHSRSRSAKYSRSKSLQSSRSNKSLQQKSKSNKSIFSGTIIYDHTIALNPFKWHPSDLTNHPQYNNWDNLMLGTHILDKNTCLTWIVAKNTKSIKIKNQLNDKKLDDKKLDDKKLDDKKLNDKKLNDKKLNVTKCLALAPCQTLQLDLPTPIKLAHFNPALCLNPFLPDLSKIPSGTRFYFNDDTRCYQLNSEAKLQGFQISRQPQIFLITINSLYNTQQLLPLNSKINASNLQQSTEGCQNLHQWLANLTPGNDILPGYLGQLPKITDLYNGDLLYFYDPNRKLNPHIRGLNPDGSEYLSDQHESKYFQFQLRVVVDEFISSEENSPLKLGATQINVLPHHKYQSNNCYLKLPLKKYLRSLVLIDSHSTESLVIWNQDAKFEISGKDQADKLLSVIQQKIKQLTFPLNQIQVKSIETDAEQILWHFTHLGSGISGLVASSDSQKSNKYRNSGYYYLGHSYSPNQLMTHSPDTHIFETELNLAEFKIDEITLDGTSINCDTKLDSNYHIYHLIESLNMALKQSNYNLTLSCSLLGDQSWSFILIGIIEQMPLFVFKSEQENTFTLDFI